MKTNKRWMLPVVSGFLAVYVTTMGLSTWLSADRYRESFQTAYWNREVQAREMLQTLGETAEQEAGTDDAFEERFARYLLGTLCAHGSRYQQLSGAVYDEDGKKIAEAGNSISIAYGYPYGRSHSQPASWPVEDYLTEEEKEELAEYVALNFQKLEESMEKMDAWDKEPPPDSFEEYALTVYVASENREPYGIFVQKMCWELEGEGVKDPLTGTGGILTYENYPDEKYYLTNGEIVWQWGETTPPKGNGFIRSALYTGNAFPYMSSGYDAWKNWEENAYLHDFPEEFSKRSEDDSGNSVRSGTGDRWKRTVMPLVTGTGSGYSMILAYDSHPWLAAMDNMKYVYLGCGILMLVCIWKILRVIDQNYKKREALEENRRDFTNAMAHELKTPLGIIRGFAENLLEQVKEEKREYYLQQIIGQTEKMDKLAAEMITLSRMDSEKLVLRREKISLTALIQEELKELPAMTSKKQIEVRCETEEDLILQGDREYLGKALRNLLVNAVMYNRMNGQIRITVAARSCTIENTGTPLSEEQLEHAFEMFYRGDESRNGNHTGLGLYLAKRILTLQGLSLDIENTQDGVRAVIRKR
ncbi:MAG: HAMP domain-containing histidine kinase [Lachnospiraceae bacterium]|nr:HAMP domain-containing histidine kinase [Lachnospiraceae bacterium]